MKIKFIKIAISLVLLGMVFVLIPSSDFRQILISANPVGLALALPIIFVSILLTTYRFYALAHRFDLNLPIRAAHFVNIMSQISGLFMFQTLGQVISRAGIGSLYTKNPQRMVLLTFLEKATSFSSLFIIALVGAIGAIRSIHVDILAIGPLIVTLGVVILSSAVIWRIGLTSGQRRYLKKTVALVHTARLEYTTLTSVFVHLLMLSAYVIIAQFFMPDTSLLLIASAFSVVMLGAAIPISFAGWGIRELTAGFVFSALSLDPATGVTVSALVGILSLVALGAHGLISNIFIPQRKIQATQLTEGHEKLHIERLIAFIGGLAIAVLIGSQTHLPAGSSTATINLADPFALMGGLTFAAMWYLWNRNKPVWRVPNLSLGIMLFITMIFMGWAIGYFTYGSNQWASVNRAFGLIILLSYLASGAMFTAFFGREKIIILLKAMIIVSATAYLVYLVAIAFKIFPDETFFGLTWYPRQFSGLAFNRNAFALQLLVVFSVLIVKPKISKSFNRELYLSIIIILIMASGSRAAMLTGILAVILAIHMESIGKQSLIKTGRYIFIFFVAQFAFLSFGKLSEILGLNFNLKAIHLLTTMQKLPLTKLQTDRVTNYIDGARMWLDNLVFGGGLGAFYESQEPIPLVIHNTLLWILAEMGLVGLIMFLFLPLFLLSHALRNGLKKAKWEDAAIVMCLFTAIIFSQFHEISYQRILWFVIGLLAANRWSLAQKTN